MRLAVVLRSSIGAALMGVALLTMLDSSLSTDGITGVVNATVTPIRVPETGYVVLEHVAFLAAVQQGDLLAATVPTTMLIERTPDPASDSSRQPETSVAASAHIAARVDAGRSVPTDRIGKSERTGESDGQNRGNVNDGSIRSPLSGRVWSINSGAIELHQAGNTIIELIDCSSLFIYTAGSSESLATAQRGARAWFRPDGHRRSWPATVLWSGAARDLEAMSRPAFVPDVAEDARYGLLVELDANPGLDAECPVGTPGRLFFENYSDQLMTSVRRWLRIDS